MRLAYSRSHLSLKSKISVLKVCLDSAAKRHFECSIRYFYSFIDVLTINLTNVYVPNSSTIS